MQPGARRAQLDATLRAAYAEGLLSADTFAARVGELLAAGPIDPERVIGDVTLRGPWSRPSSIRRWGRRVREWAAGAPRDPPLLALDWHGAPEELLVGRAEQCDIRLDDPAISRRHARLSFRDGAWVIRDLGSRNGTTLNGAAVGRSRLRPGDTIAFAGRRFLVD